MFKIGTKEIVGGFLGPVQLRGYYYHGPDGSLLKFGEFQDLNNIDPPDFPTTTLEPTSIGNASIFGNISPTEGDVVSYLILNDGDAGNLTYNWTIVGGTGSSTTDTCEVTWGTNGSGQVSCTITSTDPAVTDLSLIHI